MKTAAKDLGRSLGLDHVFSLVGHQQPLRRAAVGGVENKGLPGTVEKSAALSETRSHQVND